MPDTVTRTVLFDRVNYTVPDSTDPKKRQRMTATKGDKLELEKAEADRLEALGAVGTEKALVASIAGQAAPTRPTSASDLRLMTVDGLAAYMASASEDEQEQVSEWMEELLAEKAADTENTREALSRAAGVTTSDSPAPKPPPTPGATATDEQLAEMKAADLVAYLSQHPEDIDRVESANEAKEKPYSTVTQALEKTREELAKNGA